MTAPGTMTYRDAHALAALSQTERAVLKLLAQGQTAREIAVSRGRSVKTVATQRASIYRATGCRTLADLTRFAVRTGLIEP